MCLQFGFRVRLGLHIEHSPAIPLDLERGLVAYDQVGFEVLVQLELDLHRGGIGATSRLYRAAARQYRGHIQTVSGCNKAVSGPHPDCIGLQQGSIGAISRLYRTATRQYRGWVTAVPGLQQPVTGWLQGCITAASTLTLTFWMP